MKSEQLFIPKTIKVGFQKRGGTYTGKLAYVVYFDQKGVLRKESSWDCWRDKKIPPVEIENKPTTGFVLNKGVGGQRQSHGWNARNEYIRVYDPRDFEFEISVANLLFILKEGDCSRGKGLEGKFVYSWSGTELVLLPVASQDYKNSANFTSLQGKSVKAKDLIVGASYVTKKQAVLTYLGRFIRHLTVGKDDPDLKYVFLDGKKYVFMSDMKHIAAVNSTVVCPNYAELVDAYNKSIYGSKVVGLFTKKVSRKPKDYYEFWVYEESPGVFMQCTTHYGYPGALGQREITYVQVHFRTFLKDDKLVQECCYKTAYKDPARRNLYTEDRLPNFIEPTNLRLWARLESGSEFEVGRYTLNDSQTMENENENGQ